MYRIQKLDRTTRNVIHGNPNSNTNIINNKADVMTI
jgi:hypothetical protein